MIERRKKESSLDKKFNNVLIKKTIFKGFGLGHINGKTIFVPRTFPGDVVNVKVISEKKDYYKALVEEYVEYGVERREPLCSAFDDCGGCDMLDIDYSKQLEIKKNVMIDIFPKHKELIADCVASPSDTNYRNKVFFPVAQNDDVITYGMYKKMTHNVVDTSDCCLVPKIIHSIANEVCICLTNAHEKVYHERSGKGNIRHIGFRINYLNQIIVMIVTKKNKLAFTNVLVKTITEKFPNVVGIIQNINSTNSNVIVGKEEKVLFGDDFFIDKIGSKKFKINYLSFFQINSKQIENIYNTIYADLSPHTNLLDAYSGVSTIGIYMADKVNKVISVENNPNAVRDAKYNAKMNGVNNLEAINAELEDVFAATVKKHDINTIIFDPPRKGLDEKIRGYLLNCDIKQIIYLSCNPTTQQRDVKELMKLGYKIVKIIPFDMFPNTYHIESYMLLSK